jgi:hypothetical protein
VCDIKLGIIHGWTGSHSLNRSPQCLLLSFLIISSHVSISKRWKREKRLRVMGPLVGVNYIQFPSSSFFVKFVRFRRGFKKDSIPASPSESDRLFGLTPAFQA